MILGGLWHGASLTFLVWGALQGLALALERIFNYGTKRSTHPLRATAQILDTFVFVCLSWIIFRASNLTDVGSYFKAVFSFKKSAPLNSLAPEFFPLIGILIFLGLAMHAFPQKWRAACTKFYSYIPLPLKGLFIALTILLVSVVSMSGVAPFIYFSF